MRLPGHPCSAGCGTITTLPGNCPACSQKNNERRGETSTRRGYDADHRRLRVLCFQRDDWTCVDCRWMPDIVRDAATYGLDTPPTPLILEELRQRFNRRDTHLHADHDIPFQSNPDLRLDLNNYKTRCNHCHSAKTLREFNDSFALPVVRSPYA